MFAIPSLKDLVERARISFRTNMPGSDAWIWPNNINPTAKVLAGMEHEVFGFADYIQRQKFALTADSENLDLHGEELGLARRPTSPARFFVDITAAAAITVQVSAQFTRADGQIYLATAGGSSTGAGVTTVEVIAASDGASTTPTAGTPLVITSGVVGDDTATAVVSSTAGSISPGTDIEDDETFRARILFRKRNPPHGGSPADYVLWASSVSGVTRVYVERRWIGAGTVRVFVMMDDRYADGIPSVADVARVQDYIDLVAPAGAAVTVAAPLPVAVPVQIANLVPSNTAVQEAVVAELRAAFRRLSAVAGNDTPHDGMPYLATAQSFSREWIGQAISNAAGQKRHMLVAPPADIPLVPGEIATLGAVTFT